MVLESPFLCSASIAYTKNGITTIRLTRQWEFLERREITKSTTSFDFKTELRADLDTEYRLDGYWIAASGNPSLSYRVNNASSSSLTGDGYARTLDGTSSTGASLVISIATGGEGGDYTLLQSLFYGKSGQYRFCHSTAQHSTAATTSLTREESVAAKWHDNSTKLTALGVESATDGILTGSRFDLYRRPQFDKTKLKLWVY